MALRRLLPLCSGLAAVIVAALPVAGSAATFSDVEVHSAYPPAVFVASPPLCPAGSVAQTIEVKETGVPFRPPQPFDPGYYPNPNALSNAPAVIVTGTSSFTCADGSGTFEFSWHGHGGRLMEFSPPLTGRFHVTGGTGRYSGLSGGGTFSSLFVGCCGIGLMLDFDGRLSLG